MCAGFFAYGCQVDTKTGKGAASLIGKGVVNDPANKSLRFDMLTFGMKEFCSELMLRGAPLRLGDRQPVIGRYFANSCKTKVIDTIDKNTIVVQFGGHGYAWTAATGRLGFRSQGLLELAPDFIVREEAMYVYFRPVQVDTSDFELLMTERILAQVAAGVAGVSEKELGQAIMTAQLGRGFTAIRYDEDGHADFALGLVEPGDTPFRPYQVHSSPRHTAANGRTELFRGQQDFIGKILVEKGEALTLTLQVEGVNSIDFSLISEQNAQPYLKEYLKKPGAHRPQVVPSYQSSASAKAPTRAQVSLPAGYYYLVLDHSSAWGASTPDEKELPARIDYLIQTGIPDKVR